MIKNQKVAKGQALTGGLEFFAVKTGAVSLVPTADAGTPERAEQDAAWVKVFQTVALFANPVIVSDLSAKGFTFAVEKKGAVEAAKLQEELRKLTAIPFGAGATKTLAAVVVAAAALDLHSGE